MGGPTVCQSLRCGLPYTVTATRPDTHVKGLKIITPVLKLRRESGAWNRSQVSDSLLRVFFSVDTSWPGVSGAGGFGNPRAMPRCTARGRPPPGPCGGSVASRLASLFPAPRCPRCPRGSPGSFPRSWRAPPQDVSAPHPAGSDLGSGFRPLPGPQGPSPTAPGPRPPPRPGTAPSPPPPRALRTSETIPQRTQGLIEVPELKDRRFPRAAHSCVRARHPARR